MAQKLFEFAVIYTPPQTRDEREAGKRPKSVLIVDVQRILADDEKQVAMLAARAIPDEYKDRITEVDIQIRPFRPA